MVLGLFAYRKMDQRSHVGIWQDVRTSLLRDSVARRRLAGGGVLVAFEGGEGSGKSTQMQLLARSLADEGVDVADHSRARRDRRRRRHPGAAAARERAAERPGGGAAVRGRPRAPRRPVIRPALERGAVVLTDRFVDCSLAYQGVGRELTMEEVRRISRWATGGLRPDLTVLLDVPAEVGLSRARTALGRRPARARVDRLPRAGAAGASGRWPTPTRGATSCSTRTRPPQELARRGVAAGGGG